MGFFSNIFGRGKTRISPNQWAHSAIKQLTSEEWNDIRKEFYKQSKAQLNEIISIPEHIFTAEVLGAQLELLSFVSVKTDINLSYAVIPEIYKYLNNLNQNIKDLVEGGFKNANRKVAAFGIRGISADIAIATSCAERLQLDFSSELIQKLAEELEALGQVWINDISQYKFDETVRNMNG